MLSNIDFGSYFHTKKYEKGLSTGGDKIADWGGAVRGAGGAMSPPVFMLKEALLWLPRISIIQMWDTGTRFSGWIPDSKLKI
jgi:hypothetical protein